MTSYFYSNVPKGELVKCQGLDRVRVPFLMEDSAALDWLFYKVPLQGGRHVPDVVCYNLARNLAAKIPLTLYVEVFGTERVEVLRQTKGPSGTQPPPDISFLQTWVHNRVVDLYPKVGLRWEDRRIMLRDCPASGMDIS